MKNKILILPTLLMMLSCLANAEPINKPLKSDQRAKTIIYREDQIYNISANYLISTDIIFSSDEIINPENIRLGDSSAWDVQAYQNHLYIKAKKLDASGNLSVTTDKYTYHFMLNVSDETSANNKTVFIKFTYPEVSNESRRVEREKLRVEKEICRDKRKYNLQYSFTGDAEQAPVAACDDGTFTYFKFRKNVEIPAVFMVLPDRREASVNYRFENGYFVIERTAKAFSLRNGDVFTSVYNDKYIGDWKYVK